MKHRIDRYGKEIKVNGVRWADCVTEEAAKTIESALEKLFSQAPLLP